VKPVELAEQWCKENAKYIQPQDIWVWLEAAFVAGYNQGTDMIDFNALLNTALAKANQPLLERVNELRDSCAKAWQEVGALKAYTNNMQSRINIASENFAKLHDRVVALEGRATEQRFDEMYNNIKDNVLADLEEMIRAGADKLLQEHLEQFNHDAYDAHLQNANIKDEDINAFNERVRRALVDTLRD